MANQLILGRALDANGFIMPGAKATVYADGTSSLISVYSDVAGTILAANPIIADGNGMWPQRFVTEDAKVVVTDAANVPLYTLDPAPTAQGTGAAASAVSFAPTVDLPFTNVQTAIEGAAAFAASGFAAFGLGITGNATLLPNLDATTTGAGVYRFDGTTTGTFPSGITAGDTGLVEMWRQSASAAVMELYHGTSNRKFRRRMTGSVWGAWRENVEVNQGAVEGDLIYRGAAEWTRLAKGTSGQVLQMNTGATAPEWGSGLASATAQAATSGTSIDFTGISSAARRISVILSDVSTNGTSNFIVQIGDGAYITTGYSGTQGESTASAVQTLLISSGFVVAGDATAARAWHGVLTLIRISGNTWVASGTFGSTATAYTTWVGGSLTLSGSLDRLRLTTVSGADVFDNGLVNIIVEV